jgi:hypothetical protein
MANFKRHHEWCMKHDKLYRETFVEDFPHKMLGIIPSIKKLWKKALNGDLGSIVCLNEFNGFPYM